MFVSAALRCGVEANIWKARLDAPAEKEPAYLSPFHNAGDKYHLR